MPKILNSILTTLVFLMGFIAFDSWNRFVLAGLAILVIVIFVNYLRLKIFGAKMPDYWQLVMPGLYVLGLLGALASISSLTFKILLDVVGSGVFYYYQTNFLVNPESEVDQEFFTLSTALLVLVLIWSLNFYYHAPWWTTTLLTSICFFLMFSEIFYKIKVPSRILWATVNSLVLAEVHAAVLYWPVNFLTAAVIVFSVFYSLYIFTKLYFAHRLTSKRIYFHTALILAVVFGAVISSAWTV
ncbi:MAG: hypothetical protein Q8R08_02750 [bacterium]|nr:hypothetical protein [bacterium]